MKILIILASVVLALVVGVAVADSVLLELDRLVAAAGWWGLLIFLAPTIAIVLFDTFH